MSRNAIALIDCNNRDTLLQFIIDYIDRKAVKNEMVSPYDDQLIGKMNFRYDGIDYAMFFTFARSSEYPGMKFRNHKIIYASLGVGTVCSEIFTMICQQFGGFVNHDDDLEIGFQKVERIKANVESKLFSLPERPNAEIQPAETGSNLEHGMVEQPLECQKYTEDVESIENRETAFNIDNGYEENINREMNADVNSAEAGIVEKENSKSVNEKPMADRNHRHKRKRDKQHPNKEPESPQNMKDAQETALASRGTDIRAQNDGA